MQLISNIIRQFQVISYWYIAALENIKDDDGRKLIHADTNSMEWIAGHLITGRYRNLLRLGVQIEPYKHLDKFVNQTIPPPNAVAFDSKIKYPDLTECRTQWIIYADTLQETLDNFDERKLKTEIPFTVPIGGNTIEDSLLFIVMHETYHIGQMSIIRKCLGYTAMQLFLKK